MSRCVDECYCLLVNNCKPIQSAADRNNFLAFRKRRFSANYFGQYCYSVFMIVMLAFLGLFESLLLVLNKVTVTTCFINPHSNGGFKVKFFNYILGVVCTWLDTRLIHQTMNLPKQTMVLCSRPNYPGRKIHA